MKNKILIFLLIASFFYVGFRYIPNIEFFSKYTESMAQNNQESNSHVNDKLYRFSIVFPQTPTFNKKTVFVEEKNTTLQAHEYLYNDKLSYSIHSTKLPSLWTLLGSKFIYDSSSKKMNEIQGNIIHKEISKHNSSPSMTYLLENKDGGQTKGVLILHKNILHKIEITAKGDLSEDDLLEVNNFISSFSII